ncbi:response regulator [Seleniivibrio woodruffii]|uniref:response regulator n=1 Tax=Seleniivibrio woodruffii TaxID=1078050 RepID=UPI0026EEA9BD|nr:response regulator [Seleniivibrio woodruffii]
MTNSGDNLIFALEDDLDSPMASHGEDFWKVLIVDDEPDIHTTTKMVLDDFIFEDRKLKFYSAYSAKEAIDIMNQIKDFAVILLDVVMESNIAGLNLAKMIRGEMGNRFSRIILRTGQPGEAPEKKVIAEYDINDYKNKAELTSQQLYTTMFSALRSYRDLRIINRNSEGLKQIINSTANLFQRQNLEQLAQGVLTQVVSILGLENSYYVSTSGFTAARTGESDFRIIAATGRFTQCIGVNIDTCTPIPTEIVPYLKEAVIKEKSGFIDSHYVGYFPTMKDKIHLLFIEDCSQDLGPEIENLLTIFNHNAGIAFDNVILNKEIQETQIDIIHHLGEVVESRSKETAYHVKRVSEYTYTIAIEMGFHEEQAQLFKMASPMHDIGKIGISDSILLKPDRLSSEEMNIMRTHTEIGYNMLKNSSRPLLQTSAVIARDHHEYWDGSGYPRGISGEEIHPSARIVCLADVYDALGSKRVYKEAWAEEDVLQFIENNRGKMFDPKAVDALIRAYAKIALIKERYKDPE